MRNMLIATAAVAALCASSLPAAAGPQTNDQAARPSQQQRARNDDQRRICVTEQASESRINRRVCRTAREWREANDAEVEAAR